MQKLGQLIAATKTRLQPARKLGASSRSRAITRSRELGSWRGDGPFHPIGRMESAPAPGAMKTWRCEGAYGLCAHIVQEAYE